MSTGFLALSVTVKVTVGALPGTALSTFCMAATSPGREVDLEGIRCAPGTEASKSRVDLLMWQFWHWLSSIWGRFKWFWPVAKFTSSWQDPQAARVGLFFQ